MKVYLRNKTGRKIQSKIHEPNPKNKDMTMVRVWYHDESERESCVFYMKGHEDGKVTLFRTSSTGMVPYISVEDKGVVCTLSKQ